jgi:hypothetical protein
MPKYTKSRGRKTLVRKKRYPAHPYEVLHALSTTRADDFKHYRNVAQSYLDGTKVPPIPLKKDALVHMVHNTQQYLTSEAAHDFQQGDKQLGGGIASATAVITGEIGHLIGADQFLDWLGHVKKPQKSQSFESEVAAYLTDLGYKDPNERPDKAMMFDRLDKYDTQHCSVWQNRNTGDLLLTIRGTKLNASDISQDLQLMAGQTKFEDLEFKGVMDKLQSDFPNERYSVAGHSLGCAYIMEEAPRYHDQWDNTFLFNAPSSPAQNDGVLENRVNNYGLDFYSNHGDILGANTNYMFNNETLDEHVYWGGYQWSPVSAHGMTQWYPQDIEDNYKPPAPPESWLTPYEFKPETPAQTPVETWLTPYEWKSEN